MNRLASFVLLVLAIAACGGDDDTTTVPDEILPASTYADRCAAPRSGKDANGDVFPDKKGNLLDEQLFLRSWIDDTYLWYTEVPRADPKTFDDTQSYFDVLKTGVFTDSGKEKDHFHFTYTTEEWVALSQSGVEASYGLTWSLLASSPPRKIIVAYVQPGSAAEMAGITRGTEGISVDGEAVVDGSPAKLNPGLFPTEADVTHTLVVLDRGATTPRTVMLKSSSLASTPVSAKLLPPPYDKVGYMQFNDHIQTAEKGLVDAINAFKAAGATDVVIDLRYNGGGYLAIAGELGYMIAGPPAAGKVFDQIQFNNKHTTTDPITGQALTPEGFLDKAQGFTVPTGTLLPHLDLTRVFVLTGPGTCSASEAVMNGLAGIDVQVLQFGQTTCGKPYGFYPQDNCGTTYFAIQFQGVNAKGFGDYADGITPGKQNPVGCVIADDFTHDLGDPAEARLAAALRYLTDPTALCPAGVARSSNPLAAADGVVLKPTWLQNAIIAPPKHPLQP
ncbi:MAG: S41 family peptidase [Kofleriaceae bacterium]